MQRALTQRLQTVLHGQTNESAAQWGGISSESVRRYLAGDPPSAKFLIAVCEHTGTNGHWLLTGSGQPEWAAQGKAGLRGVTMADLLAEVGRRLELAKNL
jgi:hypothetical protein